MFTYGISPDISSSQMHDREDKRKQIPTASALFLFYHKTYTMS